MRAPRDNHDAARLPRLILIDAPFSPRLSRYSRWAATRSPLRNTSTARAVMRTSSSSFTKRECGITPERVGGLIPESLGGISPESSLMTQQHHLNHATWDCKYHVVFIPKYRRKAVFGKIKTNLGAVFHDLARRRECRIEEGHLMPDHVHMLVSIPPKYSVAEVIGFIKGKSSIWIAQNIERKAKNFTGHKFWARGYFVSTVEHKESRLKVGMLPLVASFDHEPTAKDAVFDGFPQIKSRKINDFHHQCD